jgi:hypothetical protein
MATRTTMDRDVAGIREELAGINQQLKTLVPQVQTIHDALEGDKGIIAWRKGVDIERGFVRVVVPIILGGVVTLFGNSCSLRSNVSPLITPKPIAVSTPIPTDTPTPTADPTPAPEPPATDAPVPTVEPTPDMSATPTQITPGAIVEVTPLGEGYRWGTAIPKIQSLDAWYVPSARQNVRLGPGVTYPVKYRLSAGQKVQVYAEILEMPVEAWLCLDVGRLCDEAIAYVWDKAFMGELIYE